MGEDDRAVYHLKGCHGKERTDLFNSAPWIAMGRKNYEETFFSSV